MIYDVIVVGSGPAGGMAAKTLTSAGFSVLIVDKKKQIGQPIQCAEGITRFSLENVNLTPHLSWIKLAVKGIKVFVPKNHLFYSIEPGYSINREKFEQWLIQNSVDAGATVEMLTKVHSVQKNHKQWMIQTNKGEFKGNIIIAADGPLSTIATIQNMIQNRTYRFGIQYKFPSEVFNDFDKEWFNIYWNDVSLKGGYYWIFPRSNEINIGVAGPKNVKFFLDRFCKKFHINSRRRLAVNAGIIPFHYLVNKYVKDNILLVGDAAGLTNPTTGGGIHAALFSGKLAGEIIVKALETEDFSYVDTYDKKLRSTPFLHPFHLRTAKYLSKWTDEDWMFLGNTFHGKDQQDPFLLLTCFAEMCKHPKYFKRIRELLIIKKAMKINIKYGW
jgi:digeranylgeranylglycerophospholipid reductase